MPLESWNCLHLIIPEKPAAAVLPVTCFAEEPEFSTDEGADLGSPRCYVEHSEEDIENRHTSDESQSNRSWGDKVEQHEVKDTLGPDHEAAEKEHIDILLESA